MLHVLLVINSNTHRAYSWRIFLVFRVSESINSVHLLSRTERVTASITFSKQGISCFLNLSMLNVEYLTGSFL